MYFDKEENKVVQYQPNLEDPRKSYTETIFNPTQVKSIRLVVKDMLDQNSENKNKDNIVFVAQYTSHDDYGPMDEISVFSRKEDAWNFVLAKKKNEGVTNISVMPRILDINLN